MPFLIYSEENAYPKNKILNFPVAGVQEWLGGVEWHHQHSIASLWIPMERHGQCLLLAPLLQRLYFHLFFSSDWLQFSFWLTLGLQCFSNLRSQSSCGGKGNVTSVVITPAGCLSAFSRLLSHECTVEHPAHEMASSLRPCVLKFLM